MYLRHFYILSIFLLTDTTTTEIYTLSLHDALPICLCPECPDGARPRVTFVMGSQDIRHPRRSEEHTSELQSRGHLVCRLLLEKKKKQAKYKKNTETAQSDELTTSRFAGSINDPTN